MSSQIKNIILFLGAGAILVLIYIFFIRQPSDTPTLVSSSEATPSTTATSSNPSVAGDFLTLLLNVKNIKLDDAILSDTAFNSLRDSSITLSQDGTEGRPNPFAPFGAAATPPVRVSP